MLRFLTAGESHGPGNVVIVDGCPPGLPLSEADLLEDLARRRPGQSRIVSQRDEPDTPEILSGVFEGVTTGTSIAVLVRNADARSRDARRSNSGTGRRPCSPSSGRNWFSVERNATNASAATPRCRTWRAIS